MMPTDTSLVDGKFLWAMSQAPHCGNLIKAYNSEPWPQPFTGRFYTGTLPLNYPHVSHWEILRKCYMHWIMYILHNCMLDMTALLERYSDPTWIFKQTSTKERNHNICLSEYGLSYSEELFLVLSIYLIILLFLPIIPNSIPNNI